MSLGKRIALAGGILLGDALIFFLPLTALLMAFVIVARPRWFLILMTRIYNNVR